MTTIAEDMITLQGGAITALVFISLAVIAAFVVIIWALVNR